MFTGIIEEVGTIESVNSGQDSAVLKIKASKVLENTQVGDSIAVNGVCLTATSITANYFTADVMPETLRRSNLGKLISGSRVNLERAMAAEGRFGGHIVSGHIDGCGTIKSLKEEGNATWVTISCDMSILKLIVEKGSITIDGISLTVARVSDSDFAVSLIPHTAKETTLLTKKPGDMVNLENDIVGKYVQRLLGFKEDKESRVTLEFLRENGF